MTLRCLVFLLAVAVNLGLSCRAGASPQYLSVPAAQLRSALNTSAASGVVAVPGFRMRETPVTHAEFLEFVRTHPQWRRSRVARALADGAYLKNWADDLDPGSETSSRQPVTGVSWFAARAYCQWEGARLPNWNEWELAASADETRRDARSDPAWRRRILDWYAKPAAQPAAVGGTANVYGIRDMQGLIWEWVDDAQALLVNSDSRDQDGAQALPSCGGAALSLRDPGEYATAMRVALLSSLQAADTVGSLGFRCVRPDTQENP